MEHSGLVSDKYYTDFVPTNSARAILKAGSHLYCSEDIVVKGKLGMGYFASVFLVHHRPTNQLMAMKLTNESSVQRREIELLSSLQHENVLKLYGSCVIGAKFACLTEFANGGSLAGMLSAKLIDLPWSVRVNLAWDIAKGLHHLHSHDLIHRDLSSANILIRVGPLNPSAQVEMTDCTDSAIAHNLAYGVSVGHNLLVPDSTFMHECLVNTHVQLPSTATRLPYSVKNATEVSANGSYHSPSPQPSPGRTVSAVERERMGDIGSCQSEMVNLVDVVNGDRLSPSSNRSKRPPPNRFIAVPVVEPIWKRAAWTSLLSQANGYTAIVADLGLCLDLSQEHADAVSLVGNPYYIAPECLNRVAPYTFAADVFSYGILLCELITRLINDGNRIPRTHEFGLDHQKLPVPPSCPRWFLQVALDCCMVDHTKRPSLSHILSRFSDHLSDPFSFASSALLSACHITPPTYVPNGSNDTHVPIVSSPSLDV
ncbi:hypothetical protein EG68_10505 [Paragonimus skrjabini miyazakii]|uniref:dual-specificity kinase n=1 Tax=Paragonimus skrjabini miyazakii TaxID=59628 RepID=A0A8S9YA02_9TREM|nr:hypothetical protein EG68_10505 [Paragonimus skrjabini miyazakii]